jgi:uncharacterized membrane protein
VNEGVGFLRMVEPSPHGPVQRPTALHTRTLAVVTLAVLVLMQARHHYAPDVARGYLVWNLFLAWVPYVCARLIWRAWRRGVWLPALLPLTVPWLAFLPNAPYLVTDVVHVHRAWRGMPLLLDLAVFATLGLAGLLLGVASMQPVHRLVAERFGRRAATAFPPLTALAVAFGVYLGRVQRWNSWSFVETPGTLLHATWALVAHPIGHPRAVGGIALFTVAFLLVYLVLTSELPRRPGRPLGRPQRQS